MDMKKYYSQLIGTKIVGFEFEKDEYSLEPFPVFTLAFVDQRIKMSISMDSHGFGRDVGYIDTVMDECETCSGHGELEEEENE